MPQNNKTQIIIGIDPGVNTGVAIYSKETKKLVSVVSTEIHEAMKIVSQNYAAHGQALLVRFEDARLRNWFGTAGREQLQGAGSIKRDCKIWEDFLSSLGVPFEMIPPNRNVTKLNKEQFKRITEYPFRTNEHGRDAAMLVFGM